MVKTPKERKHGAESTAANSAFEPRPFTAPKKTDVPIEEPANLFDAYLQRKSMLEPVQRAQAERRASENSTGMPDQLKSGLENLSGMDLSSVRVKYNSPEPAKVNALAYTQGSNIYVGPGQQRHLAHEGWHSVQQMQGRVQPTMKAHGVAINDDPGLEREADVMGGKAANLGRAGKQLED